MDFTVFYTFVKDAGVRVPVTIGYDAPRSMIAALAAHDMPQFIHSGNWWNIAPEKRTKDIVLAKQASFVNSCTSGIMSTNVQPGNDPLYWVTGALGDAHMQTCLENASFARDQRALHGIDVPVYCTLQPSTLQMAETWFSKAVDEGHEHLCMGVSEFLSNPKYRKEGTRRLLEIVASVGSMVRARGISFHLSGLTSYNLLPVVAALGVTSTDGSTPVQPALAYGTVFSPNGKGFQASKLETIIDSIEWACGCPVCAGKEGKVLAGCFKERHARLVHNLHVWQALVHTINKDILPGPRSWYERNKENLGAASRGAWKTALDVLA